MTLREKFELDGTTLAGVQGELAADCLDETVTEIARDRKYILSQIECGDYILDVLGSGDTILILESDIDEPYHSDIHHLLPAQYRVTQYPPDGGGAAVYNPSSIHGETFRTVEAARAAIKQTLGGKTYGKWDGLPEHNDVEAWHESEDEGCGGYAISTITEQN